MSENTNRPGPAAGWWIDPGDDNQLRYWNGQAWSEYVLAKPAWWGATIAPDNPVVAGGAGERRRPRAAVGTVVVAAAAALVLIIGASLLFSGSDDSADADRAQGESSTKSTTTPSPTAVPKALVPNVVGANRAQASRKLEQAGLTVATVRRVPSAEPRGTVLRQGTQPGVSLTLKTGVALVLAAPLPLVPAVVGEVGQQARASLRAAGFRVRVVTARRTSGRDRRVLSQVPSSTDRALPGSVVKLVIADVVVPKPKPQSPPQNCTTGYDPCLTPMSDYDCAGGSGDGPGYADGPVRITGSDPYELDDDDDGVACED